MTSTTTKTVLGKLRLYIATSPLSRGLITITTVILVLTLFDHLANSIAPVVMSIITLFFLIIFYGFATRVAFLLLVLLLLLLGFFFLFLFFLSLVLLTLEFTHCFSFLIFIIVVGDISVIPITLSLTVCSTVGI